MTNFAARKLTSRICSDPLAAFHRGTTATASARGAARMHHPPQPGAPLNPPPPQAFSGPPPPGSARYLPPFPASPGLAPPRPPFFHGPVPGHLPPTPHGTRQQQPYQNDGRWSAAKVPRRGDAPSDQRRQHVGRGGGGRGGGGRGRGGSILFKPSMVEDPWSELIQAAAKRPEALAAAACWDASAWSDAGQMDRPWH